MDMRLDLFVLLSLASQHLVANVLWVYIFIYFSVTAVAGVEFLTSNTHARGERRGRVAAAARARDECAHNFMGERDFAARNWVICQ
jgi:hypothetical protein